MISMVLEILIDEDNDSEVSLYDLGELITTQRTNVKKYMDGELNVLPVTSLDKVEDLLKFFGTLDRNGHMSVSFRLMMNAVNFIKESHEKTRKGHVRGRREIRLPMTTVRPSSFISTGASGTHSFSLTYTLN